MFADLINLFFPNVCYVCEQALIKGENCICTYCRHSLPKTNLHIEGSQQLSARLYELQHLEHLLSYFKFTKSGKVQKLLHELKYSGKKEIGELVGHWYASELIEAGFKEKFELVLPIPLHKSKLIKRGYNQVDGFAKVLAEQLDAEYRVDILWKGNATESQTKKTRWGRFVNTEGMFHVKSGEEISNKKLLIVDDVLTTGATLVSAIKPLQEFKPATISVATIAMAWK